MPADAHQAQPGNPLMANPFRACAGVCGGRPRPRRRDNSPSRQVLSSERNIKGLSDNPTNSPREYPPLVKGGDREARRTAPLFFCPYSAISGIIHSAANLVMRCYFRRIVRPATLSDSATPTCAPVTLIETFFAFIICAPVAPAITAAPAVAAL
jgi:hypothetical protein